MDTVRIRNWKRQDLDQIADLWLELAHDVKPMDGFYRLSPGAGRRYRDYLSGAYNDGNFTVFVAETSEKLVGFAMGRIRKNPPVVIPESVGYIENVYVKKEKRQLKIGTTLCDSLLDWFKKRGIGHVELFYQIENRGAAAFWKKMGFMTWLAKAYRVL